MDKLVQEFFELKKDGLEAKNPDQSVAMMMSFYEVIDTCRWKGFSKNDMVILFQAALKH